MINLPLLPSVASKPAVSPPRHTKPTLIIVLLTFFGVVSLAIALQQIQYRKNLNEKASAGIPSNLNPNNFSCNGKTFKLEVGELLNEINVGKYSTFATITLIDGGDSAQITYWKAECACNSDQGSDANGFCTTAANCITNDNQTLDLAKNSPQTITLTGVNGFGQNCGSFQNDLLVRKVDGVDCFTGDYPSAPNQYKVYGLCNNNQTTRYRTNCADGLIAGSCPLATATPIAGQTCQITDLVCVGATTNQISLGWRVVNPNAGDNIQVWRSHNTNPAYYNQNVSGDLSLNPVPVTTFIDDSSRSSKAFICGEQYEYQVTCTKDGGGTPATINCRLSDCSNPTATPIPIVTPTPTPTNTPKPTVTIKPTPTPTKNPACGNNCTSSAQCPAGLSCLSVSGKKMCVNPVCPGIANCVCPPTPTPTVQFSAVCRNIVAYTTDWQIITDWSTYSVGQPVYLTVLGSSNTIAGITKARFRINNGSWVETSDKRDGRFYFRWVINKTGSQRVEAMIYDLGLGWY